MSQFQHYEWQTMDRLLTEKEQEAVGDLSSHIEVTSSRAVVTYAYGDFKHDARDVLVRFFDAHLYMANWGSRRLIFRFPAGLLLRDTIGPYCVRDSIKLKTVGKFDVLDMDLSEEGDGAWIDEEGCLSGVISLRNDLLQGDYRSLYLAWLKAMSLAGGDPDGGRKSPASCRLAPPIPPGLERLSPALKRFVDMFGIDRHLVETAAELSPVLAEQSETDFLPLVARLPREECDAFLCRIAQGDTTVGMELKRRLQSFAPRQPVKPATGKTIGELLNRADSIRDARKRHQEKDARKKHAAEMAALADRETETWQEVEYFVQLKQIKHYDTAVKLLVQLKALSEFRDTRDDFRTQLTALCDRFKRLSGFLWRVREAKLLDQNPVEE